MCVAVGRVLDDKVGKPVFTVPHGADEGVWLVSIDHKEVGGYNAVGFQVHPPHGGGAGRAAQARGQVAGGPRVIRHPYLFPPVAVSPLLGTCHGHKASQA